MVQCSSSSSVEKPDGGESPVKILAHTSLPILRILAPPRDPQYSTSSTTELSGELEMGKEAQLLEAASAGNNSKVEVSSLSKISLRSN